MFVGTGVHKCTGIEHSRIPLISHSSPRLIVCAPSYSNRKNIGIFPASFIQLLECTIHTVQMEEGYEYVCSVSSFPFQMLICHRRLSLAPSLVLLCLLQNSPVDVTVPKEDSCAVEAAATIREWGALARNMFMVCCCIGTFVFVVCYCGCGVRPLVCYPTYSLAIYMAHSSLRYTSTQLTYYVVPPPPPPPPPPHSNANTKRTTSFAKALPT